MPTSHVQRDRRRGTLQLIRQIDGRLFPSASSQQRRRRLSGRGRGTGSGTRRQRARKPTVDSWVRLRSHRLKKTCTEADLTVQVCWDADRLDLGRVGISPRRDYLCTDPAKDPRMIQWAEARSRDRVVPRIVREDWLLRLE